MPAFVLGRATIGITITTDPVNDTDDVMGDHSPADGPDPTNWTFLATVPDWPADATRRLAYGHTFSKTGEGYQVHGVVSHVVDKQGRWRSEEHTSELQSLMRISYADFCWK